MKKSITACMIVKNEDQFVWYAVMSVLPYVDKFLIFDTGSTDKTVSLIKKIKDKKIFLEGKGKVDRKEIVRLRNEQIKKSLSDWIWIVDGDEIYPTKTVNAILKIIHGERKYKGIIVHRYDLLGDIYHYQKETIGAYNQFGKIGHYVLRLIHKKSIDGFQVLGEYPNEYFADKSGESIKKYGAKQFAFIEERIFHAMYLKRSSIGANLPEVLNRRKYRIELGKEIPEEDIPEIFFKDKPDGIPNVTKKRSFLYLCIALLLTPIKNLKRKLFSCINELIH